MPALSSSFDLRLPQCSGSRWMAWGFGMIMAPVGLQLHLWLLIPD